MLHFHTWLRLILLVIMLATGADCFSQDLYTARGYWEESTKKTYLDIKQKQTAEGSLTEEESNYLQDYEAYLASYYERLSEEEKQRYEQMKEQWDKELSGQRSSVAEEEFEWKFTDRWLLFNYGLLYGSSVVVGAEIDNASTIVAIPLITAGAWLLGPTINPKKYEGITRTAIRAGNTGKFLGLLNGTSLGLMIAGNADKPYKATLLLASAGSITMGEIGFQLQKKRALTDGYVGMIRHYGILGPGVGVSLGLSAGVENENLIGASLLAGGVAGLIIGNSIAKSYDYTSGDVAAVSSLGVISTGIGFAAVAEGLSNEGSNALLLIPTATAITGTILAQRSVKGVRLTKKQGSNLYLATAGAAAIGLGFAILTQSESANVIIGIPSGLSLITHQILFNKYKRDNLERNSTGQLFGKRSPRFSLKLMAENYFVNKKIPEGKYATLEGLFWITKIIPPEDDPLNISNFSSAEAKLVLGSSQILDLHSLVFLFYGPTDTLFYHFTALNGSADMLIKVINEDPDNCRMAGTLELNNGAEAYQFSGLVKP